MLGEHIFDYNLSAARRGRRHGVDYSNNPSNAGNFNRPIDTLNKLSRVQLNQMRAIVT